MLPFILKTKYLQLIIILNKLNCGPIQIMTLGELKIGEKAIIKSFNNDKLALRLLEMGCLPGEEVIIKSTTPMGDPIIIELNAGLYALRLENANEIEVMPCL